MASKRTYNEQDEADTTTSSSKVAKTEDACDGQLIRREYGEVIKDDKYNMDHKYRGVALIFNHENFEREPKREGTQRDKVLAHKTLAKLGFAVECYDDRSKDEIKQLLEKVSKMDHSENDCIMIVVLTHGDEKGCLDAKDSSYFRRDLYEPFIGSQCPSLVGKPKIFIIQACWGNKRMKESLQRDSVDRNYSYNSIPTHSDLFIYTAAFEGFAAFRNPDLGSDFIQRLMSEINKEAFKLDLLTIVLRNQRIIENTDFQQKEGLCKQVPSLILTCGKIIQFTEKVLPEPCPDKLLIKSETIRCLEEIDMANCSKMKEQRLLDDIKSQGVIKLRNVPQHALDHVKYAAPTVEHLELVKASHDQLCLLSKMPKLKRLTAHTTLNVERKRKDKSTPYEGDTSRAENRSKEELSDSSQQLPPLDNLQLQHLESSVALHYLKWLLMGTKKTLETLFLKVGTPLASRTNKTKAEWPRNCNNLDEILQDCKLDCEASCLKKIVLLRDKQGLHHNKEQCDIQITKIKKIFKTEDKVTVEVLCKDCQVNRSRNS